MRYTTLTFSNGRTLKIMESPADVMTAQASAILNGGAEMITLTEIKIDGRTVDDSPIYYGRIVYVCATEIATITPDYLEWVRIGT